MSRTKIPAQVVDPIDDRAPVQSVAVESNSTVPTGHLPEWTQNHAEALWLKDVSLITEAMDLWPANIAFTAHRVFWIEARVCIEVAPGFRERKPGDRGSLAVPQAILGYRPDPKDDKGSPSSFFMGHNIRLRDPLFDALDRGDPRDPRREWPILPGRALRIHRRCAAIATWLRRARLAALRHRQNLLKQPRHRRAALEIGAVVAADDLLKIKPPPGYERA
jgi:hypothetical protein